MSKTTTAAAAPLSDRFQGSGTTMSPSPDRKWFYAALALFLVWVAMLTGLAIVSSYRPAQRTAIPVEISTPHNHPADDGVSASGSENSESENREP
jgi:hypothetical protein